MKSYNQSENDKNGKKTHWKTQKHPNLRLSKRRPLFTVLEEIARVVAEQKKSRRKAARKETAFFIVLSTEEEDSLITDLRNFASRFCTRPKDESLIDLLKWFAKLNYSGVTELFSVAYFSPGAPHKGKKPRFAFWFHKHI